MPVQVIDGATIDDLTRDAVDVILKEGHSVPSSTEGANTELLGVTLNLTNPRARLSRTESRGKPFSCLGELCWYLSGSAATEQITYYVSRYRKYDEAGRIHGAYGPRLYSAFGTDQLQNVTHVLKTKPSSRQAVVQLFDAMDIAADAPPAPAGKKRDIPCTCTLQFFVRDGALHMITYMRSNDAWFGLTHDVFCFTMLQELIARSISQELGSYIHMTGSLHIYDKYRPRAERLASEGWQSTKHEMPAMPPGDPYPSLQQLLEAERAIRVDGSLPAGIIDELDPYWADLIRLLQAYRYRKDGDLSAIERIRHQMVSRVYDVYLSDAMQTPNAGTSQGTAQDVL